MIKILADQYIPDVHRYFEKFATVQTFSPNALSQTMLKSADALLVRSVTPVNENLLHNTSVQFVGSATAGVDHLDQHWLTQHNIVWASAPGANATAVAEYVLCAVAALIHAGDLSIPFRAGVIGAGRVGTRVGALLEQLGANVLYNDPPRAERDPAFRSTQRDALAALDLVCLHTPLVMIGPHPTHHLLTSDFLDRMRPGSILLNAGRGACLDTQALLRAQHLHLCLDVWENEPHIDPQLLKQTRIATPHIAGYSHGAKQHATAMLFDAAAKHFGWHALTESPPLSMPHLPKDWQTRCQNTFNPMTYSHTLKASGDFQACRQDFPLRPDITVPCVALS